MTIEDTFGQIEAAEFAAKLNLASSPRAFFRWLGRDSAVDRLRGEMRTSGENTEKVLSRIVDLSLQPIDERYENPHDSALAALLWVTCSAAPEFAESAAVSVNQAPGTWYAKKLAHQVLTPARVTIVKPAEPGSRSVPAKNVKESLIIKNPGVRSFRAAKPVTTQVGAPMASGELFK